MKALTNEAELQKHVFRNSTRLSTYEKMREEVMSALTAERRKFPGQAKGSGTQNPTADRECFYCHRKGLVEEECRIRMADERDSKNKDEKDKKDKRFRQKEKKRMNALEGRGQGNSGTSNSSTSQGEVQATVGALQARMIFAPRAMHGSTINSTEVAGDGTPNERMRLAPLRNAWMLDSGVQVSAVPRQQIDEMHYNLGPSNVTGLKGISGEDIPRHGHVELNTSSGQDVVQVVADIEHGIIATDAIVN